jgi:hypothetical protein
MTQPREKRPHSPLRSRIVRAASLSSAEIDEMFDLFRLYYVDVSPERFRTDLDEKTHVLMFRDRTGRLAGFSTILRKSLPTIGPGIFLFSGDTVIHEDHWGTKALQRVFFKFIVRTKLRARGRPVYWMLISKGYKTYLMMRRNFAIAHPSPESFFPAELRKIRDRFYRWKFGRCFEPASGLISFERPQGAVKGSIAVPTRSQCEDPQVAAFLSLNPGYRDGIELACIAEIRWRDFAGHVAKYFVKTRARSFGR